MFQISKLCTPALIYLILSIVSIISMFLSGNLILLIIGNVIFMVFWTWILNLICKEGYEVISWILVIVPIIIMLIIVSMTVGIVAGAQLAKENENKNKQK
jgi:hypothetical protein